MNKENILSSAEVNQVLLLFAPKRSQLTFTATVKRERMDPSTRKEMVLNRYRSNAQQRQSKASVMSIEQAD